MEQLLIQNALVFQPDGKTKEQDILVQDAMIQQMGKISSTSVAGRVINGKNKLAMPGFVNAHTHAAMTLFRSYADDMLLMDWLKHKIWPAENNLRDDDVYWGTMLAIAEMLRSGTTTFADMYFFMPEVAKAVADTGIRAVLARGMAGVAPNGQAALGESETFFNEWNQAADGRITVMLGPHAPYTCPPDYLKQVVSLAGKLGAQIHIHLAETAGEVADCMKQYSRSPIGLMEELGVLDCGVLAAHCVHLSSEDIELMVHKKVRVAHNPGSNMKLASGIARVSDLLAANITVGLGTDGAASNNNLDMLEEARLAALLHKTATGDPTVLPAGQALQLATTGGAEAVGLGNVTGRLEPGYRADIVLFDMTGLKWQPRHDPVSLLVYSADSSDVDTVIVDGKILLENRRLTTIDEERVIFEANRISARLVGN